jgi:hypothetical protein
MGIERVARRTRNDLRLTSGSQDVSEAFQLNDLASSKSNRGLSPLRQCRNHMA